MEATNYTSIGPVLQLNKAGELTQKRMKAVKVCDSLYISEPDKTQFVKMIIEYNGVMWIEHAIPAKHVNFEVLTKRMPAVLKAIEDRRLTTMNEYRQEIDRRIFSPESPAIMELKKSERKKPAQLLDGTIRAKVIQYKSDGNTLAENWHTLTKFSEGIYLSYAAPDKYGQVYATVVFAKNGVFWKAGCELEQCFRPDIPGYAERVETLKKRYANYEADIMQAATNGGWLNKLHITVMERLGHDTAAMIEAHNERRRKMEEHDRQRAEEMERQEKERKEAEKRRKAEVLADCKEKLLNNRPITEEQIELIADCLDYKINIRTLGFMREKVAEAVLRENDVVTVWGRKLTSRSIDGTAKVMRELCARLKAQAGKGAELTTAMAI